MSIKAVDVKNLREKTGLGMMECKKALEESQGNLEEAITNLRKNSALKAEKKSSRTAVEGIIIAEKKENDIVVVVSSSSKWCDEVWFSGNSRPVSGSIRIAA